MEVSKSAEMNESDTCEVENLVKTYLICELRVEDKFFKDERQYHLTICNKVDNLIWINCELCETKVEP